MGKKRQNRPKNVFFCPQAQEQKDKLLLKEKKCCYYTKLTTLKLDEKPCSAPVNSDATAARTVEHVIYMYFYGKITANHVRHQPP